ncbi:type IV-A pilus assembly ATPase PilB [Methylococcus geothermalis]|uniref:Type IV-A pilus assembly ATPase PilB n=1 Tax=Methylococcus geothermalis TaxID=2681310 RepID=A0A858Q7T5_9GAMM|nr:type IV-A pilus assembly ATPase PilB [Methylococcus geothermalis]QJD29919.1 type IV-A pilus assembly ATPase PilB [Methylococcus geothermalis]
MAAVPGVQQLSGLAKSLVKAEMLSEADAQAYFEDARRKKTPFVSYLVSNKILDSLKIAQVAHQEFGLPLLDLDAVAFEIPPTQWVSEKLIRHHHILPLMRRGNHLFVAVSDPTNFLGLDEITFQTRLVTDCILVEEDKLSRCIEAVLDAADTSLKQLLEEDLDSLQITAGDDDGPHADPEISGIDDAPIVRFVNRLLLDAVRKGASDIHIEPYEKFLRIRFRHDGILHEVANPPAALGVKICARIKVMSRMDIAEHRIPQDGRIKMTLSRSRAIDFRVNTCPTLFGEKIVLRILDPGSAQIGVEMLGFEPEQRDNFLRALEKPYGMILVTGPTGSGKTVTLYTGLNLLNRVEANISTVEDPVEITVPGINQVNVNYKTGLTFAEALRAFLRQDPDIIMVGEIRDLETAEIAVKAAQTGHLVLSTLHTNDAPQTLNRLMQMGIPAFNIASSVILIMAQRLARRLCPHCKREEKVPPEVLLASGFREGDIGRFTLYGPAGCEQCVKGYKGRVGIYQVMPISEEINRIILEGGNVMTLTEQAHAEGIADLRESGLKKVKAGVTSLEEIDRVTRD